MPRCVSLSRGSVSLSPGCRHFVTGCRHLVTGDRQLLMLRSHWENTSAMVKYTNFLPMLPVASRYFGKKHKCSHYKFDFLGFGEGPANHGHEWSAMAPDAWGSIGEHSPFGDGSQKLPRT